MEKLGLCPNLDFRLDLSCCILIPVVIFSILSPVGKIYFVPGFLVVILFLPSVDPASGLESMECLRIRLLDHGRVYVI